MNTTAYLGSLKWGLYDLVDHCWYGTATGPLLYADRQTARAAATIMNERFQWFRIRSAPYLVDAIKLKDTRTPPLTVQEAMRRLRA